MTLRPGQARPTMRDVAVRAGVGLKTVSRVVNNEPNVSPETAARVNAAVAELGYRHNLLASNLRRGDRTLTLGVLVQDLANSFSATLLRAVEEEALSNGYAVFTSSLDEEYDRERYLVANLVSRRIDGLILMPSTDDHAYLAGSVADGLKVVVVDRPAVNLPVDSVLVDNRHGSSAAVEHLIAVGHRRIGFISDLPEIYTASERHRGYRDALARHDLPLDPALVLTESRTAAQGQESASRLLDLDDPPTALFTARNEITIGAVRALRERGLSDSVALVGFDDFPLADLLTPGVTVVRQDARAVGRKAAESLLKRLAGDTSAPRLMMLPARVVERGSGEIPPPSPSPARRGRATSRRTPGGGAPLGAPPRGGG